MRNLSLLVLCLTLLLVVGCQRRIQLHGMALNPPEPAKDFTLTDEHNGTFTLSEQKGNVVLLFFGYTHCPDICPGTLAVWKKAESLLGADAERVRFVFITVDPERDTPERLAMHVDAFSPTFIGLTGDTEELQAVYASYGVYAEKETESETAAGYLMGHTAATFVIDPEGQWRSLMPFGVTGEDVAADVEALLK